MVSISSPPSLATGSVQQLGRMVARPRSVAVVALIGANLLWSGSPAASKEAMADLGPLTVAAGRVGMAVLVFAVVLAARSERFATGRTPVVLGLCGMALFAGLQNLGLLFADATTTSLIGGAKPVLIAALAVPLLGERLHVSQVAGLLCSMAGVGLIVMVDAGRTPEAAAGSLLPLASAVAFALYAVLSRRAFGGSASLPIVAGATRYGFLFLLPLALVELIISGEPVVEWPAMAHLAYLGVGCSALAFMLCGYGYARLTAAEAAPFTNLRLAAGVALGALLLGEPLTWGRLVGGLLVLAGVAMATRIVPRPRVTAAMHRHTPATVRSGGVAR